MMFLQQHFRFVFTGRGPAVASARRLEVPEAPGRDAATALLRRESLWPWGLQARVSSAGMDIAALLTGRSQKCVYYITRQQLHFAVHRLQVCQACDIERLHQPARDPGALAQLPVAPL